MVLAPHLIIGVPCYLSDFDDNLQRLRFRCSTKGLVSLQNVVEFEAMGHCNAGSIFRLKLEPPLRPCFDLCQQPRLKFFCAS